MKKRYLLSIALLTVSLTLGACTQSSSSEVKETTAAETTAAETTEETTEEETTEEETTAAETKDDSVADTSALEDTLNAMYEINHPQLGLMTMNIDTGEAGAVKSYTGLDSSDEIESIVVSEPMMSSQAYSLVLVQVKEGADVQAVAEQMKAGIDPAKWICVCADEVRVVASGNTIMLFMISEDLSPYAAADEMTDAFKTVCGDLTVDLK